MPLSAAACRYIFHLVAPVTGKERLAAVNTSICALTVLISLPDSLLETAVPAAPTVLKFTLQQLDSEHIVNLTRFAAFIFSFFLFATFHTKLLCKLRRPACSYARWH